MNTVKKITLISLITAFMCCTIFCVPTSALLLNDEVTSIEYLDNGDRIITVDHREPKLKVLKDFYEVYFKFDKTVHDRKYDIRKYAKMLA